MSGAEQCSLHGTTLIYTQRVYLTASGNGDESSRSSRAAQKWRAGSCRGGLALSPLAGRGVVCLASSSRF